MYVVGIPGWDKSGEESECSPWGDDAFGVDDALPGDVGVVEARGRVGGEVLHADADLTGALGCWPVMMRESAECFLFKQCEEVKWKTHACRRAWRCGRTT